MSLITDGNPLEHHISLAEIYDKQGRVAMSLKEAKLALDHNPSKEKEVAIKLFIAKAYTKLGDINKSTELYRQLLDEGVYLPPVLLGILHNNLTQNKYAKVKKNIHLVKLFDI